MPKFSRQQRIHFFMLLSNFSWQKHNSDEAESERLTKKWFDSLCNGNNFFPPLLQQNMWEYLNKTEFMIWNLKTCCSLCIFLFPFQRSTLSRPGAFALFSAFENHFPKHYPRSLAPSSYCRSPFPEDNSAADSTNGLNEDLCIASRWLLSTYFVASISIHDKCRRSREGNFFQKD